MATTAYQDWSACMYILSNLGSGSNVLELYIIRQLFVLYDLFFLKVSF